MLKNIARIKGESTWILNDIVRVEFDEKGKHFVYYDQRSDMTPEEANLLVDEFLLQKTAAEALLDAN